MNPAPPPAPAARAGLETRCADCAHLRGGCGESAAEALAGQGWPRAQVRPVPGAWARDCPGFAPSAAFLAGLREPAGGRARDALERARSFTPH